MRWLFALPEAPQPRCGSQRCLQKLKVWGREIGEGRQTGVGICGVPRCQCGPPRMGLTLAASVEKCFRVEDCGDAGDDDWVTSQLRFWKGDLPATVWCGVAGPGRVAAPKSILRLLFEARISSPLPLAGSAGVRGSGRPGANKQRRVKGSAGSAHPQPDMQAIYNGRPGRSNQDWGATQ